MALLLPTVDNREERIFYLTQVEIMARCAPLVGAVVRAQEAVARDDPAALEADRAHSDEPALDELESRVVVTELREFCGGDQAFGGRHR
jgi:hypothetical protein